MGEVEGKGEGAGMPAGLGSKFERMAEIMAELRAPGGCPWDLEQTPETLARHLLEEAYESVDAIEAGDWAHLEEELGDLLLQIVFQSRIAEESGRFDLSDVVDGITEKLERRHPHIFGDVEAATAEQVSINWDRIKREEEGEAEGMKMPEGLPATMSALKIQGRAARDGFDWTEGADVFVKLEEEIEELEEAKDGPREDLTRELGDVLFTVVNLSRHLGIDPERALRATCREFVRRYALMEGEAGQRGTDLASISLEEKESLWQQVNGERLEGEKR
ncbi:MAG: nucleoside triphosphate pyrophosphohydrolase [Actinobacteria bacterium]|nr:nucleoside triphosphate pyrophosphohydrolase [Actinomycetota bacterium]